ncbi:Uncharacterised protein [Serratia quinivorans]|uniref:hypothetical protein n=1 Tax=Serratia quinivorans TaxID=137545 RepID=UPI0021770279|nr:hypothetical protein [Serratia quinivorans]CAI1963382.1 Uncharacterised protein [Serratia quinivorans]
MQIRYFDLMENAMSITYADLQHALKEKRQALDTLKQELNAQIITLVEEYEKSLCLKQTHLNIKIHQCDVSVNPAYGQLPRVEILRRTGVIQQDPELGKHVKFTLLTRIGEDVCLKPDAEIEVEIRVAMGSDGYIVEVDKRQLQIPQNGGSTAYDEVCGYIKQQVQSICYA